MANWRDPIHPGEVLANELKEIGLNGHQLAKHLHLPYGRVYDILRGERSITAATALSLGQFLRTGPEFWLNLQQHYDLEIAQKENRTILKKIKPFPGSQDYQVETHV
ncbi:MAG: HigA family addiction module antidote protein [Nitrospirales bacterium]|nr:HigA family addiction module antidote protein [Nitrospirales bacterium]NKB82835.1 HigA family addiction module antidote protein [Nitrospirales bacterium]